MSAIIALRFNEQSKVNKTKVKQTKQNKDEKALSCCVFDTFKDCIHEPTEAEQGALTALCDEHGEYVVEQAIKAAKGKGSAIGACALWSDVDWKVVGSTTLLAGVLSLITSLIGLPEVGTVTNTETEEKDE